VKSLPSSRRRQRGVAASTWVVGGFAVVALFFLLTEHRAHLLGWLPFLLLAACPLMHLFHHGAHGSHGGEDNRPPGRDEPRPPADAPAQPDAHRHHH